VLTYSDCLPLKEIIYQKITDSPEQRITFAEYMELVLYHPQYGYYNSDRHKIGAAGDFFTSSSLGGDFGELLATQLEEMWQFLGQPADFMVVEMGAGEGLLADDILGYLASKYPDFIASLEYIIVEKSGQLMASQQNLLKKWENKPVKINWQTWPSIADESIVGCCFSNELIDAFPVHQVVIKDGNLQEIYLIIKDNQLAEAIADISTPQLKSYFDLIGINLLSDIYPEGYRTEVNLAALDWLKEVAAKLKQGYLLTIDYGYPATKYYHPQRCQGTLKCYYQHRHHHDPYINLGYQDITAHVDFTALERQGELCRLEKLGFTLQALFLMALGLGYRLRDLSTSKFTLPEILQRRDYLHQLIEPTGLGGFGVLLQGKGLTEVQKKTPLKGLIIPYN
jgi:SAM-dependent MidA family methyltransferase